MISSIPIGGIEIKLEDITKNVGVLIPVIDSEQHKQVAEMILNASINGEKPVVVTGGKNSLTSELVTILNSQIPSYIKNHKRLTVYSEYLQAENCISYIF